jgi:hypothetical protein
MALLLQIAHPLDATPVRLRVGVGQHVQGLEYPAEVRQSEAELGGVAAALQHTHHVRGGHRPVVHRADDVQDVGPMPPDPRQVDLASGGGIEGPVVCVDVDTPQFLVGQVRQLRPVRHSEEFEQPEHHVRI